MKNLRNMSKAIRFEEQLPENFSMDDADGICRCVEYVDESVNAEIRRLEDNNNLITITVTCGNGS